MYTTTEAAALLETARRNVQNYCKRHGVQKRGRDYDISERDIEGMRGELGRPGPKSKQGKKPDIAQHIAHNERRGPAADEVLGD